MNRPFSCVKKCQSQTTELTKLYNPLTDSLRPISLQSGPSSCGRNALYPRQLSRSKELRNEENRVGNRPLELCAGLVVAQQRAGSLRGQVLDELGGAIVGASVTVIEARALKSQWSQTTPAPTQSTASLPASTPFVRSTPASQSLKLPTSRSRASKPHATRHHSESRARRTESNSCRRQS